MQYRKFIAEGEKVSALGFGCMRLPQKDGAIDEPEAIKMIRHAIDSGVNYVDTAYVYHGGKSEVVLGKALKDGYREKVMVADKIPVWMCNDEGDFVKYFEEERSRLDVEVIDLLLLHSLGSDTFHNKVLKLNMISKIKQLKAEGKVRYIGFSFHDGFDTFKEIVDTFEGADFCQIQYNYIDTDKQAGTMGLEYAASKGLAVVIMEPLLGGSLANLSANEAACLPDGANQVQTALDYLWSRPEVGVVLSGMSEMYQVEGNLKYASESKVGKLTDDQLEALKRVKSVRDGRVIVPCTGCRYCMPCPNGLDIPLIFKILNKTAPSLKIDASDEYAALEVKADSCVGCGACEEECPQHIHIRDMMKLTVETFK